MMDELWEAASEDAGRIRLQAAMARADAEMEELVMPFLLASLSPQEYGHREAMARQSMLAVAHRNDVDVTDLITVARRRYELYRQALAEGTNPMTQLERNLDGSGYGSGPEKPGEHDEGPDFSHGYSEVPAGPPGGPAPQVTRPRPPSAGPVQEATGSLRRRADYAASPMTTAPSAPAPQLPPDTGTGRGSVDMAPSPSSGGMTPSLPAGGSGSGTQPLTPPSIGQVTSSADPVRRKVMAVTAAIAAVNPQLREAECGRIARIVVGRYLREADLAGSVMNDEPVESGGQGGGGQGNGNSGGGMGQHMLEWKGLKSMMPGGGAAAGEAAGAGELAEMAPLLAL